MSAAEVRENRDMAVTKRAALGTGFGVSIGLLALSTVLAYHIQESFSERSVAIHRRYVHEQDTLTSFRRVLYSAGIAVRDHLLNPATDKTYKYHARIASLRAAS